MSGFDNEVVYAVGERLEPTTSQAIQIMQKTSTDVSNINHTGDPEGVVSANPSSLSHDPVSGNIYLKQTGTGTTGWVLLSTASTDLHTASLIVNPLGTSGTGANYSTLASAMAAAVSGQTIFLMDGTYTENVTLKPGVAVSSFTCDGLNANVIINGTLTMTDAGTCTLSGMRLQTNSSPFLTVSGSSASIVNVLGCYLNCTNNTGVSFTSSSASSQINFYYCEGNLATTGISYLNSSSAGGVSYNFCTLSNSGNSTTATTCSAGSISFGYTGLSAPVSSTGTGAIECNLSRFSAANTTVITCNGTGGQQNFNNSEFGSGTASAISVGAGAIMTITNSQISSSNTNAITGAGSISYGTLDFTGSSSTINTTTQVAFVSQVGSLKIKTPLSVSSAQTLVRDSITGAIGVGSLGFTTITIQTFTSSGTYTPTSGMKYCQIECWGGGGGGGGSAGGASAFSAAGGGGAGGYSRFTATAAAIGVSKAVTIGAAGSAGSAGTNNGGNGTATSVGVLCVANGGSGGTGSVTGNNYAGGAGGTAGTGDIAAPGMSGGMGVSPASTSNIVGLAGFGASTLVGSGGQPGNLSNGNPGTGYGSGGSGGNSNVLTNNSGGAGTAGYVIITEYI